MQKFLSLKIKKETYSISALITLLFSSEGLFELILEAVDSGDLLWITRQDKSKKN